MSKDSSPSNALPTSSIAPTLDAAPDQVAGIRSASDMASDSGPTGSDRPPVALVEGSGVELTRETEALLRRRLRLAVTLLAAGFTLFLIRHFFDADYGSAAERALLGLHAVVTAALGALAGVIWHRMSIPIRALRWLELAVFALPAVFFLVLQYFSTLYWASQGFFRFDVGLWLMLIFTYALFIPNTIRRAAVVIAGLAAAPIALLAAMVLFLPALTSCACPDTITGVVLMLGLAGVGSVFGVDTIGSLRQEAFKARKLGQYHLRRRIGAGGMGEVFLAEHQLLKRPCVVKLIHPDRTGDERALARFQREVRAMAKLSHWNTVEVFDYGRTEEGTFYYVMEYLPGMSLAELVDRYGPLPPERVIHFLRQACDALREAHSMGLIHRDIKPGNIFAAKRGGVYDVTKLLDFGLVKPVLDEQPVELTREGTITGSPLYMAPEQATGESPADARSDIYALGAVGYFLLTGRPPFQSDRAIKVMIAHAREAVVPPSQHQPHIPPDLEQIILRCLEKPPEDRFPSAEAVADALDGCEAAVQWNRQRAESWWQGQESPLPV